MNLPERWPLAGFWELALNSRSIEIPKEAGEDAGDPTDYLIAHILKLTAMEFIRPRRRWLSNCE